MVDSETNVERWEKIGKGIQGVGCALMLLLLLIPSVVLMVYVVWIFVESFFWIERI